MKKFIIIFLMLILYQQSIAQTDTSNKSVEYKFIIMDSPQQLFTMRQFNENYLSAYRLLSKELNNMNIKQDYNNIIQVILTSFLLIPLTHEEGHRSILTGMNIGSISQPYFNKNGAAYVKGVRDSTLINFRDLDLPGYIRLHTGGLESDYMLTNRIESIGSFGLDGFNNYKWEYWMRKLAILQYYITGLLSFDPDITEEMNELDRDIVGYDTYGAVRHLFRPKMPFYRYTKYDDLTEEENNLIHRMGYRSLLNLLNPLIIGKQNFSITNNIRFNIGMGYTMSPFGDFIDENLWLIVGKLNIFLYARQFENRENWFNGFGCKLINFQINDKLSTNISSHFWQQPLNLDFNTKSSFTGGAIDIDTDYFFQINGNSKINSISLNLGFIYKTKGFLPEELFLDEHFGIRLGTSINLQNN